MIINNRIKGFSLIELMVVIAIIGILAVASVQSYRDYIIRSKISEVINLASADLNKIGEWIAIHGMPASEDDAAEVNNYINIYAVDGSNYVEDATFDSDGWGFWIYINDGDLSGVDLALRYLPVLNNNTVNWVCGYVESTPGAQAGNYKYLPQQCQNSMPSEAFTALW